jgi:ectoine hydroxylase
MLNKVFAKYTGFLRNLKLSYYINNWLNARQLAHNRKLYKERGVQKSILAPIGSKDFKPSDATEIPWLDQPNAMELLEKNLEFHQLSAEEQTAVKHFVEEGYLILDSFFTNEQVNALNQEVEDLLHSGKAGFNYTGRKIMGLTDVSTLADETFFRNPRLLNFMQFILGRPLIPFHSINFIEGSEQRPHSDSIHMTTEPKGYLIAAWIALEDCHSGNGPLVFYPKSHRLNYVTTQDYESGNTFLTIGEDSNKKYEEKIAEILAAKTFEKRYFHAKKGSILLWHANLIHGGSPITQAGTTRKSMVCHYFGEGVICYHEMSQRPALMKK